MSTNLQNYLSIALERHLTASEAERAFELIMTGEASEIAIAGFLMALRARGESVEEITAATASLRSKCQAVKAPAGAMDIVGTGGDFKGTLNISTATAFVVAGAGVPVAKHGNKNQSSKSGTADALQYNGVQVMVPAEVAEQAVNHLGIGFMMAPMHHPAMKAVGPVRAELQNRTIFNIIGPLTNPAGVKRQLTGAFTAELLQPMAATLRNCGSEVAWLVHGADGTDEMSICGQTQVVALEDGAITDSIMHPEDFGLPTHALEAIIGGNPEHNGKALRAVLSGEQSAYRDAVLLNSAAALLIAGKTQSRSEAVEIAAESINSGQALTKLEGLARFTQDVVPA